MANDKSSLRFYYGLLASIVLTVVIVLVHSNAPMRELNAFERGVSTYFFTDKMDSEGGTSAGWIVSKDIVSQDKVSQDKGRVPGADGKTLSNHFSCTFLDDISNAYCGYALAFTPWDDNPFAAPEAENAHGIDISQVRYIKIRLNYRGDGTKIRLTIRSFSPELAERGVENGIVVTSYLLQPWQLNSVQYLSLDNFHPVDWFLTQNDVSVAEAKANLNQVLSIGLELPYYNVAGEHEMEFAEIAFGSKWIASRSLHQTLFWIWVFSLSFLSLSKILELRRRTVLDQKRIQQLTRSNQKLMTQSEFLKELSQRDTLTGVFNRTGFEVSWSHLNKQLRTSTGIALIVVDLDHFKSINDQFGHQVGDEILRILGGLLMANVRQTDIVCRWGGEEFVVVCEVPDARSGVDRAELIRQRIEQRFHQFRGDKNVRDERDFHGDAINVTASLGIAYSPVSSKTKPDPDRLFNLADKALYEAKEQGRNRVVLAKQ